MPSGSAQKLSHVGLGRKRQSRRSGELFPRPGSGRPDVTGLQVPRWKARRTEMCLGTDDPRFSCSEKICGTSWLPLLQGSRGASPPSSLQLGPANQALKTGSFQTWLLAGALSPLWVLLSPLWDSRVLPSLSQVVLSPVRSRYGTQSYAKDGGQVHTGPAFLFLFFFFFHLLKSRCDHFCCRTE